MGRITLFIAVVAIVFAVPATAQSRPDFSGTWNAPAGRITIKHDARMLTVTDESETRTYHLTETESRVERTGGPPPSSQQSSRARWVQNALVIETTTVSNIGTWTDLEVYSLDYGPQLSVVRVYTQTASPMMGDDRHNV